MPPSDVPGTKLVGDITYLPTWQGWLYLATVIDCHTKACIGYALAEHMRADLVIDALQMAARNYTLADGAIFHSDRGTQYTSQSFAEAAAELGVRRSVGRTGSCFDNCARGVLQRLIEGRAGAPHRLSDTGTRPEGRDACTSSSATIRSVSTRRSATEPRKRFTTSTGMSSSQRNKQDR